MVQDILLKLEDRKVEVEKEITSKMEEMRNLSRTVSEIQVLILELKGELNGVIKMLKSLKEK